MVEPFGQALHNVWVGRRQVVEFVGVGNEVKEFDHFFAGQNQFVTILPHCAPRLVAAIFAHQFGRGMDEADGAARVAALRETLEETGLAVGWPGLAESEVAEVRQALLAGTLLSEILAARGDRIALESLVPFARWCPNFKEARTFDTRFYAVAAPQHGHELTVEEAEHSHIFWASAAETLAMADRGDVSVIFPTRRNLERIAQTSDFEQFSRHSSRFPVELITPWIEDRDGRSFLCIPGHLGYPVTSESFDRVRRG